MKFNFNKLIQIIKRYKYVILFLIIVIIFLYSSSSIVEGLTGNIGEYDYLAPVNPSAENISDQTLKMFISKYVNNNFPDLNKINIPDDVPDDVKAKIKAEIKAEKERVLNDLSFAKSSFPISEILKNATKPEIEYYIKNGEWPYDGYIMNFLTNKMSKMGMRVRVDGKELTNDEQIKYYKKTDTNRQLYRNLIYPYEYNKNPLPLSAKIYEGKEKPSTYSTSPSTTTTNTNANINENYNHFVNLCKKIVK